MIIFLCSKDNIIGTESLKKIFSFLCIPSQVDLLEQKFLLREKFRPISSYEFEDNHEREDNVSQDEVCMESD